MYQVIIDTATYEAYLPHSIEAFYFPKDGDCSAPDEGQIGITGQKCEEFVRLAHAAFLEAYPTLTSEDVPLLQLDRHNWDSPGPFSVAM